MGMFALRYHLANDTAKNSPPVRATASQRLKLAKILIMALLGFAVIGYNLQRLNHSLDAASSYQPSLLENVIRLFAGK